jgi:hypothetical protein
VVPVAIWLAPRLCRVDARIVAASFVTLPKRLPGSAFLDRPFTHFGFVDAHAGHWPHRLAFDGVDRLGNFSIMRFFCLGLKMLFDELDGVDEGHGLTPSLAMSPLIAMSLGPGERLCEWSVTGCKLR